jgi:hypothetical protein
MAYDGNGVFNRLYNWEADAAAGVNILAQRMDEEMNGFATGLSQVLTRDGQAGMLANLDMGNFKITGLGDATAEGDAISRLFGDGRYLRVAGNTLEGPLKIKQGVTGANTDPMLQFLDVAGVPRWAIARDEVNGQLNIIRLSDAGVVQGALLSFNPAGVAGFNGNLSINTSGGGAALLLQNGSGVQRWGFARDAATGDLLIARFAAGTGNFQDAPIRIAQTDGVVSMPANLVASGSGSFANGVIFGTTTGQTVTSVRDVIFGAGNNMAVLQLLSGSTSVVEQRVALSGDTCLVQYVRPNINRTDISMNPGTGFFMNMGNQTGAANIVGVWNGVNAHRVSVSSSERRMKRDFKEVVNGLASVLRMKPITFRPASPEELDRVWPGFTVEDMEEIGLEELVIHNGPDNPKGLAYDRVSVYIVSAIQELTQRLIAIEEKLSQGV